MHYQRCPLLAPAQKHISRINNISRIVLCTRISKTNLILISTQRQIKQVVQIPPMPTSRLLKSTASHEIDWKYIPRLLKRLLLHQIRLTCNSVLRILSSGCGNFATLARKSSAAPPHPTCKPVSSNVYDRVMHCFKG